MHTHSRSLARVLGVFLAFACVVVVLFSVAKPAQAQDADLVDSLNQLNTALDAATADTTADTTTDLTGVDATDAAATETAAADTSTLDGITAIDQSLMGVNSQLMSLDAAVSGAAASGTVNQDVPVGFRHRRLRPLQG